MYLYLKALHIIFVVCWFSGLFYLVRLFVYYAESNHKSEPAKDILQNQYKIMIYRLWNIITYPAAVLATIFGFWMLYENPYLLQQGWMHVKLLFVVLLWLYHFRCNTFVQQIQKKQLTKSSSFFRIWNEGATIILFSVVFLVILKNAINWIFGVVGIITLAVLLMLGFKWYKKIRERNKN